MSNYKATPEQWKKVEESAAPSAVVTGGSTDSCILELRSRIEQLEAQAGNYPAIPDSSTPPPVATDEELSDTWYKGSLTPDGRHIIGRKGCRAVYNLGIEHGQAGSREVADPAPVAGEMAELVADLRIMATWAVAANQFSDGETLTRAANMIQQLSEQEAGR
jgi:hypothetical protein